LFVFFLERERERKEGKGEREKKGAVKKEAFPERRER